MKDQVDILDEYKEKEKQYIKKFTNSEINTAVVLEVSEDLGVRFGNYLTKKLGANFTHDDIEYFWSEFTQETVYK